MSIQTEITRINMARNKIRTKFVDLGIAQSTAKIEDLATAAENIQNQGAVSAEVREGETYTIPKGYHTGSGTVSGVAGGGEYNLQSKTVTPTKLQQSITSDEGYYGLSDVIVNAIPNNYNDTSSVTAIVSDVLANKIFVNSEGEQVAGTMTNQGAVSATLDTEVTTYTIPAGYHNGSGTVNIVSEEKVITPSKTAQDIVPTTGKILSKVTVQSIPAQYPDVTDATATTDTILATKTAYGIISTEGETSTYGKLVGTMTNNGAVTGSIDGLTATSYTIPAGYHNGQGVVSLASDIEEALALI